MNDVDADVFSDPLLLGHVNSAWRQLQVRLAQYNIKKTIKTSAGISMAIAATAPTLPADLVLPLEMWEKFAGVTDDKYVKMTLVDDIPDELPQERLRYWKWENGAITTQAATVANTVQIQYEAGLPSFTNTTDVIPIPFCEDFLAWKTASFAARSRGEVQFAKDCADEAGIFLDELINTHVQQAQRLTQRARPYGTPRRNFG